jgi:AGCS family alanine or glycine:cation symporter
MAGGARSVGRICEKLIPFMGALYISAALITVLFHIKAVPHALRAVIGAALTPRSAAGGAIGGAFIWGVRRSVFSNEAGLGTSGMAHAAADTDDPAEHGLYGIFEVFADTIVVCPLTALAVITSGVPLDGASGSALVCLVFSSVFGTRGAAVLVFAALVLFAYSTILGWSLYGANCLRYLFGGGAGRYAALIFPAAVFIGSVVPASAAWSAADMLNALVSVPNFIMLFALSPEIFRMARGLENKEGRP